MQGADKLIIIVKVSKKQRHKMQMHLNNADRTEMKCTFGLNKRRHFLLHIFSMADIY